MITGNSEYEFRKLDSDTWPDFERFFSKYNGVQAGCWCVYYHRTGITPGDTLEEKERNNRSLKESLVKSGKSRGVLAYGNGEVIGSCQYGTETELPRIDNMRRYKNLNLKRKERRLWRITCFFIDKNHRHNGMTEMLLKEVLNEIAIEGGGLVEAYPYTHRNAVELWFGSVNTYLRQGFKIVENFGNSNVLVRKRISPVHH